MRGSSRKVFGQMHVRACRSSGGFLAVALATTGVGFGRSGALHPTLLYSLETGSQLVDDCPVCAHVPTVVPITGTFRLVWLSEDILFTHYEWTNISLHAESLSGLRYEAVGGGTYDLRGAVAVQSFEDIGILTNHQAGYYRLRQP